VEWDSLLEQCLRTRKDELLDGIRDILSGQSLSSVSNAPTVASRLDAFVADAQSRWERLTSGLPTDSSPRFPNGFYEAGLIITPLNSSVGLAEFRATLRTSLKNHSGWPPFAILDREVYRPRPVDGAIEAWFGPDENGDFDAPAHSDYWRASPEGMFYTRRGYNEDRGFREIAPGTTFDITTPSWRLGEVLLQVHYAAIALRATESELTIWARWTGLSGRQLVSIGNPNRKLSPVTYRALQSTYEVQRSIKTSQVFDNLPEIVFETLQPLYGLFDFWQLPKRLVEEEIREMKSTRYAY
jgi:hypothetical protein